MCDGGVWLAEAKPGRKREIVSACSLVSPKGGQVPLRLLNISGEAVTVYKGTKLAEIEELGDSCVMSVEAETKRLPVTQEKQQMLWKVAEVSADDLTEEQKGIFFELLLEYAEIFQHQKRILVGPASSSTPFIQAIHNLFASQSADYPHTENKRCTPSYRK